MAAARVRSDLRCWLLLCSVGSCPRNYFSGCAQSFKHGIATVVRPAVRSPGLLLGRLIAWFSMFWAICGSWREAEVWAPATYPHVWLPKPFLHKQNSSPRKRQPEATANMPQMGSSESRFPRSSKTRTSRMRNRKEISLSICSEEFSVDRGVGLQT